MNIWDNLALVAGAVVVAGLLCHFIFHPFSPESRERRKRRRNYGRITTKARGPMVRLNVRPPRE